MHGGGGESGGCEPNLTPLLDLVLQILMFFMVTINFATEQTHEDVALPESQTARPLPKEGVKDPIFVNLRWNVKQQRYEILVTGRKEMTQLDAKHWIRKQYEDLSRFGEVKNPVIIRADKAAEYAQVYQLLQSCSDAGFRNLKVRALVY